MDNNDTDNIRFENGESQSDKLLQYEVGEVCKCYFTEISKGVDNKVSQRIDKCQAFGRITAKYPMDDKGYAVTLFDEKRTVKKLPGRCLRKVKLTPYTYDEAVSKIGEIIESNENYEDRKLSMLVTVVEDSNGIDDVEVNSISITDLKEGFHYKKNGAPFCNIVMLNADEAFK